ncbi:MAG: helix-turn-helix transcriptional regulator [Desulfuromonadales bacterium]
MQAATELLGSRIRELRKAQGIAQEHLAEVLGIEQQYMSRIELGKSYPSLDRLMRIADVLKVPLMSLFDFIHLSDEETRAQSLEDMLKGLDEEKQQLAYRVCRAVIKEIRER